MNFSRKNNVRSGLFFGIAMTVFFILQNLLQKNNQTTKEILISVISGIIAGIVSGFLFGWFMRMFRKSKFLDQATRIEVNPGEEILFQTLANHFKGVEGVGGKLYLTSKQVIFKSHKLNIQNHKLSIMLSDIDSATRYKTLGMVDNGLMITTRQNKTEKFVVEEVDRWVQLLKAYN